MRELDDLEKEARERLDCMESQISQQESGSRFQHNYSPRRSRDPRAYRNNYPATPFSSSSTLPHTPRFAYHFSRQQQHSPTSCDARTAIPPIPPPRIQSFINQNYPPQTTRFNKADIVDQPTSANLCTSNY